MAKKKTPKLCVMFDTNILYTQVASDLFRQSIKNLIVENSDHVDIDIEWYLPEVVIGERRFQMMKKAKELLPSLSKMERLLGHGFGIGSDTLEMHVNKAIDESVQKYNLKISKLKTSEVDWEFLIKKSVNREAPFEDNEKEKGFRDSVIAHCFQQLHKSSPSTPNICKLALVTEDEKLREYVAELTVGSRNVRILSNQAELESLINTLVSEIPEELAEELSQKARQIFFEKGNEKTFYYKNEVRDRIKEQYANELETSSIEGLRKIGKTWWISNPVFMKKNRSRIYWTSSVEPEFELYHFENDDLGQQATDFNQDKSSLKRPRLDDLFNNKKVVDRTGRDLIEVLWSTNLTQAQNLTAAKLEKITYLGNDLSD